MTVPAQAETIRKPLSSPAPVVNTRAELNRLLQQRLLAPQQRHRIDREIRRKFAKTQAVFILDMAGFSRTTANQGIIAVLETIYKMDQIAVPLITSHRGSVVKLEADNIFAVFPDVDAAIAASLAILTALNQNGIQACIGLGYGEILMIEDPNANDMYGTEMNFAAKLGEDLARAGELLITESAYQNQQRSVGEWERLELPISGFQLTAYKLKTLTMPAK